MEYVTLLSCLWTGGGGEIVHYADLIWLHDHLTYCLLISYIVTQAYTNFESWNHVCTMLSWWRMLLLSSSSSSLQSFAHHLCQDYQALFLVARRNSTGLLHWGRSNWWSLIYWIVTTIENELMTQSCPL